MPAAEAAFHDHGQRPDVSNLEDKPAAMTPLQINSENDRCKRQRRDHHHIRHYLAAIAEKLDVEIKPADDPAETGGTGVFVSFDN